MNKFCLYSLFLVAFIVPGALTEAAALYIDPNEATLYRGDSVTVAIRLDTDEIAGECVNAVDAVLSYDGGIEPVAVSTGNSIFSLWVEEPAINKDQKTITFAGGIPNGYCGRIVGDPQLSNIVAEVVFRSPGIMIGVPAEDQTSGTLQFNADQTLVYLNDGQGGTVRPDIYGTTINLSNELGQTLVNPWQDEVDADTIPPAKFTIYLEKDEKAFSQKWFISFNSNDKQTGIDHYEVLEEPLSRVNTFDWGAADTPWIVTRSPYVLADQSLNSVIRVKAVDKAGNETISTIIPDGAQPDSIITPKNTTAFFVYALFGAALIVLVTFVYRRVRQRKQQEDEHLEDQKDGNEYDEFTQ